jgi:cellulose synthase/poly-beta-1,6-N-acetylglucosamine synthase-like glycosyltransferase
LLFCNIALDLFALLVGKKIFKHYSYAGINFYIANIATIAVGIGWGAWFLFSIPVSLTTRLLLMATVPFLVITLPSGLIQLLEQYDIVCRETWRRPRNPFPKPSNGAPVREPMVSIHVPTYSEPPEMVIETLTKLSTIEYENYEVLVVDNNTIDPSLWLPVQAHCKGLGNKFRFFHVDTLAGAKGGALNYALKHTDPRAQMIGVVDADYHADPTFIQALIGHFEDPNVGFVQTPHDYRGWQRNVYLTMCYWEYRTFFHTTMVSLNERDAGLTVGTMCLIRKEALEKAGGWSEWCVTEDSELAIRIHHAGYSSIYVNRTYGWGLIPETFEAYKKQRYRWTAGPVQEFRHHSGLLFGLKKERSALTLTQRIFHINHGLVNIIIGLTVPAMIGCAATILSMIYHHEIIRVPFELWLAATILLLAGPTLMWLVYKKTTNPSFWEIAGQLLAYKALSHVITYSAFRTFLTGDAQWVRTNKFRSRPSYTSAILSTKTELALGLSILIFIVLSYRMLPYQGLALMLLIGLLYLSFNYLAAPLVALLNVRAMKAVVVTKEIPRITERLRQSTLSGSSISL